MLRKIVRKFCALLIYPRNSLPFNRSTMVNIYITTEEEAYDPALIMALPAASPYRLGKKLSLSIDFFKSRNRAIFVHLGLTSPLHSTPLLNTCGVSTLHPSNASPAKNSWRSQTLYIFKYWIECGVLQLFLLFKIIIVIVCMRVVNIYSHCFNILCILNCIRYAILLKNFVTRCCCFWRQMN